MDENSSKKSENINSENNSLDPYGRKMRVLRGGGVLE